MKKRDPKVGTGKKQRIRRDYTDENPKTQSLLNLLMADAQATARKVKRINKPYARKIQILTVVEQRAKVAGNQGKPLRKKSEKNSEPSTKRKTKKND